MTEGRLETESRCQECLAIIKGEVTSNNLSKRRVRTRTHGVVGGRGLVTPSYPILRSFDGQNKAMTKLPITLNFCGTGQNAEITHKN